MSTFQQTLDVALLTDPASVLILADCALQLMANDSSGGVSLAPPVDSTPTYRHVLDYLKDMSEYARLAHRHDLRDEYLDALALGNGTDVWTAAASAA